MVSPVCCLNLSPSHVDAENGTSVNTSLPLTADHLIAVLEVLRPQAVHVVPYALGLMAEKQQGVNALTACKVVTAAGSRTPDELGNRLVREGVNLGVFIRNVSAISC